MHITSKTKLCIIIGDPVEHSLSPAMHNAAYEALGIDDQFVFTACRVNIAHVKDVVTAMKVMGFRGLTCTIPHKMEVMKYLDHIDPIAQKIGAVNTVVNDEGVLKGYNTDWLGTVTPLEKLTDLKGKIVALIGAGGAARAMAYGVTSRGAMLQVYNRTKERADDIIRDFGGTSHGMDEIPTVSSADIIINATSIGMHPRKEETPIPKEYLKSTHVVFDAVYAPYETRLLREAKETGATIIHGTDMLLHQGTAQFELYTGTKAPVEVIRNVLMKK